MQPDAKPRATLPTAVMLRSCLIVALAASASALKVTVAGASGFVGSRVCKYLVDAGADVTGVSKSGKAPAGAGPWAASVTWKASDMTRGSMGDLEEVIGTPEAFVSCVGSVGFDRQNLRLGNGKANADAAKVLAKAGSVKRVAYVSVSEELFESKGWLRDCQLH